MVIIFFVFELFLGDFLWVDECDKFRVILFLEKIVLVFLILKNIL